MRVLRTDAYEKWFRRLDDRRGRARIDIAIRRFVVAGRIVGDTRPVGAGVHELRVHTGPGYRVYFVHRGQKVILLLAGGDKSSQERDIARAKNLAHELKETGRWQ